VSRESKVLIGVGALVVIGLVLALMGQTTIGVIAVLIGLVAGFAALRFTKADDGADPFAEVRTEADRSNTGTLAPNDGLAPWSPDGGLNAWTPPTDLATPPAAPSYEPPAPTYEPPAPQAPAYEAPAYEAPAYEAPAYEAPAYEAPAHEAPAHEPVSEPEPAATGAWDDSWDSTVSWAPEAEPAVDGPVDHYASPQVDSNPLDDLVGLDALDPIAEVERIEGRSTSLFGGDPHFQAPIINEQVSTADDIMAASHATELNLADGEQTELQKLLAKVQIRLSAYE
jgi:hypothetical protein